MSRERDAFLAKLKTAGADQAVLRAMADIDRKRFFDPFFGDRVWSMEAIPIGLGQKSDEPLVLARMIALLEPKKKWRVLEVGTGSGYSTAVIARMAGSVVSVDYYESLARAARDRLIAEGCRNVKFFAGDATDFEEDPGEFDAAIVFAACLRTPYSVLNVIKPGGVMVFPMGPAHQQQIVHMINRPGAERVSDNYRFFDLCTFDSIRGKYGWIDPPTVPPDTEPSERKPETKKKE